LCCEPAGPGAFDSVEGLYDEPCKKGGVIKGVVWCIFINWGVIGGSRIVPLWQQTVILIFFIL
jgi:hypothetical protein